jgi:D-glycero-alpha-D-manno-heptose 1-phosphate guanylyltransferase
MEAIVLAGGQGTRLRQVLPDVVKPMAPVGGRPFLELLLLRLATKGFHRVVMSLGYRADSIRDHFGSNFAGMEIVNVVEEASLGTGGGMRLAMRTCEADHTFVFNGDTFLDLDIAALEARWQRSRSIIIVAREVPDTARYGRLLVSGERVTGFLEKGKAGPGLINAGCYVLPKGALDDFAEGFPFSFETDFLVPEVGTTRMEYFASNGYFIDIGIPEDYALAQLELPELFRHEPSRQSARSSTDSHSRHPTDIGDQ